MRRPIWNLSLAGVCAGALLCGSATAQIPSGQTPSGPTPSGQAPSGQAPAKAGPNAGGTKGADDDKGPLDVTADTLDKFDDQHLVIYRGNVEAVQNGARLTCDVLNVYFEPTPPAAGGAAPAKPSASTSTAQDGFGQLKQAVAEGHVFYVTQTQTARGNHAVYDAAPDTVTMTGDVVVVQGQNVLRGDKMVMELKTGHTQVFANITGRNKPGRVRGVFYNDNQNGSDQGAQGQTGQGQKSQGQGNQGQGSQGKTAAAPAKKS